MSRYRKGQKRQRFGRFYIYGIPSLNTYRAVAFMRCSMTRFKTNRIPELLAFWVLQAGQSQGKREEVGGWGRRGVFPSYTSSQPVRIANMFEIHWFEKMCPFYI